MTSLLCEICQLRGGDRKEKKLTFRLVNARMRHYCTQIHMYLQTKSTTLQPLIAFMGIPRALYVKNQIFL